MSAKPNVPVVRPVAWASALIQIPVVVGFILLFRPMGYPLGIAVAAVTYVVLSYSFRTYVNRHHSRGMRRIWAGDHAGAIPEFEKAYDYFSRHSWIDKYRYVWSSSRLAYREMALCNAAYCHMQLGNVSAAKSSLRKAVEEFPKGHMASATLNMIETIEKSNGDQLADSH
ncbi:MAG: hypothetical protein AMXMBFR84_01130 [Candidatus Hydrogenedentota bacterium]